MDQVTNLSSSDEFELQKIYIYIYKGEKIFTVQSYLFNILTRNLSKHVGSTPGMNYCCTLAPMKRNIYAVLLDTSHCQNTIDGWHMGWRMLSRQCFHGKHTLASHYNTFRHQRFIVGERNGKCADYFYPRTGTDVCWNFSLLVGRREKGKSIKKKKFGSLFGWSHKNICMVLSEFYRRKVEDCTSNFLWRNKRKRG